MRDNNQGRKNRIKRKIGRNVISAVLIIAMVMNYIPMPFIGDFLQDKLNIIQVIKAQTGGTEVPLSSKQAIINYSQNYNSSHKYDTLVITNSTGEIQGAFTGFQSIGAGADDAFCGTIKVDSTVTLNLPSAMFNYISDDVDIFDLNGHPTTLRITRPGTSVDEPLFAKNVVHTRSTGSASWSFEYDRFYDPGDIAGTGSYYINDFAGYIGNIGEEANVDVTSIIHNNKNDSDIADITATGNVGLVCGTLGPKAVLKINSIIIDETNGVSSKAYSVSSTSSGHAGGLVGSMGDGSKLILANSLTNPQSASQVISAADGYAGGIVGYCDGGTIDYAEASEAPDISGLPINPGTGEPLDVGDPLELEDSNDIGEPSEIEEDSEKEETSEAEESSEIEETSEAEESSEMEETSEAEETSEMEETSEAEESSEIEKTSETENNSETEDSSEMADSPEVEEHSETSDLPEEGETSEVLETFEMPENSGVITVEGQNISSGPSIGYGSTEFVGLDKNRDFDSPEFVLKSRITKMENPEESQGIEEPMEPEEPDSNLPKDPEEQGEPEEPETTAVPYSITQVITGSAGSGAVAGYYSTISTNAEASETGRYAIDTTKYNITNGCKVNGNGNCGGLFGDVVNDGDMTISGATGVSIDHGSGNASSFGGLIGKYTAAKLSDSLTITVTGTVSPSKTGGTVVQYGGIIGIVAGDTSEGADNPNAAYVKVSGISVSSSNADATSNFGGVIGSAAASFIDFDGNSTVSFSGVSTKYTFGGIVGDIGNGVLYLQDTVDLSGTPAVTTAANSSGQVVGYRDCGLVFAEAGWEMTRSTSSQELDDVGSWGEIVRFNNTNLIQTNVLTIAPDDGHYVTLLPAVLSMSTVTEFVKTALNIQLNNGQNTGVLRCSGSKSEALLESNLELASDSTSINLSGTGITGLTRDNVRSASDSDSYITFTGTFDGKGGSIAFATGEEYFTSSTAGNGIIYRHPYIGLFGKTSGATIQNLNISHDSVITVDAQRKMYVGNVVGQASGALKLEDIEICSYTDESSVGGVPATPTYATINASGSMVNIGGMVGNLNGAGEVSIEDCVYNGDIRNTANSSYIGGLVGSVTESDTFGIEINGSEIGGLITSAGSSNEVGGAIARIDASDSASSGRKVKINELEIDGIAMGVYGESGGFLGHKWLKTDVEFHSSGSGGVKVENASLIATADTAGLVHTATGYWKVNTDGIDLSSLSIKADSAESFGLIVNNGITGSAIYMELAPDSYSVSKNDVRLDLPTSGIVFDEIVAYSAHGDVSNNGQGVVSIATTGHALLKMNNNDFTGSTYQHQTEFLDENPDLIFNSHTRYYYNLDDYRSGSISNAAKLLMWSVYQYAHSSIKSYFSIGAVDSLTGVDASAGDGEESQPVAEDQFDMRGYSYYPVDLSGTLTINNGNIKLWNSDFDTTENTTDDKRLSTEDAQHYLIHNSLFRNVSGTFTGNDIELDGKVNKIGDYCGVLVMGTVSSEASGNKAKISVDGLLLDGIKIGDVTTSDSKPLLVNKAGKNVVFDIKNVSNNASSYTSMGTGASTPAYIASSLLGVIGSSTARDVTLNFEGIKLDGRNSNGVTNLPELTTVYHSNGSLFSKATLVETLAYESNSGSYGVYNYSYAEDWGGSPPDRKVTYGYEIIGTEENKDTDVTPNVSKQRQYYSGSEYTHPTDPAASAPYNLFTSYFQRYVFTPYVANGTNHELRVNLSTTSFRGCGTYNDPYIITNGGDLETIAKLINGTHTGNFTICVPKAVTDSVKTATWCTNKSDHNIFTTFTRVPGDREASIWSTGGSSPISITDATLGEYLAGAYYQIDPSDPSIVVTLRTGENGFQGISNNVTDQYVFHGVIDGTGHTIVNETTNPLIVSSNGSVVNNVTLEVQPSSPKTINTASNRYKSEFKLNGTGCDFYGAVIGQIFGGDNIIDRVKIKFTGTIVSANNNAYVYTAPIGGYVGVIVNGGLIFRGMSGTADNNEAGLSSSNLDKFPKGNGNTPSDPLASDNTKWLYVNPIIGRVLNGYAITESTTFKPFENGTRTYSDGSGVVFNGNSYEEVNDVASYTGTKVGVTMKNNTKNYSIADISTSDKNSFAMDGIADDSNITVSSAQALYIISLITESGLGKSTDGKYYNGGTLKPYDEYMSTHVGNYHYVGDSDLASGAAPTEDTPNKTDAQKDYLAITEDKYASADLTAKVPYIIKTYTPKTGDVYPAFDIAGGNGRFFNLILSTTNVFYLPDSYRGLGSLMFGVNISSDLDDFKDNIMHLYSMNGGKKNLSLNMKLMVYSDDNYLTLKGTQANFKTGLGFINCLQSKNKSGTHAFKDITILGGVKYEMIDRTTGGHVSYNNENGVLANPAVAAFVGVPVAEKSGASPIPYNINFSNVVIDSMDISGMCYSGGFVGALNMTGTLNFEGCGADNLKIFAGAAAGGLIGYMRHKEAKVTADFSKLNETTGEIENGTFGIISIISANTDTAEATYVKHGAGGLIGNRTSTYSSLDKNIDISYVTICNGTSATSGGYIGCFIEKNNDTEIITNPNVVPAGGIIGGASQTSIITADHVTVENLNIYGAYSGGFVGRLDSANSKVTISDSKVTTDTDPICTIHSTYNDGAGASGGFIGKNDGLVASLITDSILMNYSISGYYNVGGVIGYNSNASLPNVTMTNIELTNHSIIGDHHIGGLVGKHSYGELNGYNILINMQKSLAFSGGSIENNGYVVGANNNKNIKLVGFSRQGTVDMDKMVGNSSSAENENYGSGYVIFADYTNYAKTAPNDKFSNVSAYGENIGIVGVGSKTEVIEYNIVAYRDKEKNDITGNIHILAVYPTIISTTHGEFDPSIGKGIVISNYSGYRYRYQYNKNSGKDLRKWSYTSLANNNLKYDGGKIVGNDGGANTYANASNSEKTKYNSYCAEYLGEYKDDQNTEAVELFVITQTEKTNEYESGDTSSNPFVITSAKVDITGNITEIIDEEEVTYRQFLTGDGVNNASSYYGSPAQSIIADIAKGSSEAKRYQSTGLNETQRNKLSTTLINNMMTINRAVSSADNHENIQEFPVLLIDDLSTVNDTVNNYLKLLTNTQFNFYNGYSDGNSFSGHDKSIYNVSITKWKYDSGKKAFVKQSGEASLKCNVNEKFYITPTEVDNLNWQISLIDVQFYDPGNLPVFDGTSIDEEGLIAYHLYVPVVVKKMLHYSFSTRLASGTTYELGAYPSSVANLVENLGNPITTKITYTYQQSASDWQSAINGGESVYRYYHKILDFASWGGTFPADAKVVLVNPNNNSDSYYISNFAGSGSVFNYVRDEGGINYYTLDLNSFSGFNYPRINDLLNISIDTSEEATKNLVVWTEGVDSIDEVVAEINAGTTGKGTKLRLKKTGETGTHAVHVDLKDYQQDTQGNVQENYYLSIFTKEDREKSDTNIYHYSISSSGNTLGDAYYDYAEEKKGNYPTAKVGNNETAHLFLGNIYSNSLTITPLTTERKISKSNDTLVARMDAKVGFTPSAVAKNIQQYITNDNVNIYQTFLFSLNKLNGTTNERGILVDPLNVVQSDYSVESSDKSTHLKGYRIYGNYIELLTDYSIKSELSQAAEAGKASGVPDDYLISISEKVAVQYAESAFSAQFPRSSESSNEIGTYMIGYSNISSEFDNSVSSKASYNTESNGESQQSRKLYYIEDDSSVTFSYNATSNDAFQNDGNANYGQLGLDGNELDLVNDRYVQINTAAFYNIHEYNQKDLAHYVKLEIKLSKKDDYSEVLDIPTYLADFKVLDVGGGEIVPGENIVALKPRNGVYTYIIPLSELTEVSEDAYSIPITFKAYSGNNTDFEQRESGDMEYSNYKVKVSVSLLETINSSPLSNSDKFDHIIYTNAKLHSEIIERNP